MCTCVCILGGGVVFKKLTDPGTNPHEWRWLLVSQAEWQCDRHLVSLTEILKRQLATKCAMHNHYKADCSEFPSRTGRQCE